jgi:hypothetical protein
MPCRKETLEVKLYNGYLGMQKHHYRQEKTMISHMLPNRTGGVSTKKNHMYFFRFQETCNFCSKLFAQKTKGTRLILQDRLAKYIIECWQVSIGYLNAGLNFPDCAFVKSSWYLLSWM